MATRSRQDEQYDVRGALLEALLDKVKADRFPSSTMLDLIEELLTPEELQDYAETLLERVREENFPSISVLGRLRALA